MKKDLKQCLQDNSNKNKIALNEIKYTEKYKYNTFVVRSTSFFFFNLTKWINLKFTVHAVLVHN